MKRKYSHKEFERDVQIITRRISEGHKIYKNIYAVPRGGLILGVRLSHTLDLPLISKMHHISKDTLIVDEIVDTGKTLNTYKDYDIVCLHWKTHASFEPFFYCNKTKSWIVYWWEEKC